MITSITRGMSRENIAKINQLIEIANRVEKLTGGPGLNVNKSMAGYSLALDYPTLIRNIRFNRGRGGDVGEVHKAYCKVAAGAGTTITCYLDTDGTGDEITVNCSIANGSNLNVASPRLSDGTLIFVKQFNSDWYCDTVFQKTKDCTCT